MKPIIGLNASVSSVGKTKRLMSTLGHTYVNSIKAAGGIPLVLPPIEDKNDIKRVLGMLDGLLMIGGRDLDPALYGEKKSRKTKPAKPERQNFDMEIAKMALKKDMPMLGICMGIQVINVAAGGTLHQHIFDDFDTKIKHQSTKRIMSLIHSVDVVKGTKLHKIVKNTKIRVNSSHHQAVKDIGKGFVVNAVSPDGIIEGMEHKTKPFVVCTQWHPEAISQYPEHMAIFKALVNAAKKK